MGHVKDLLLDADYEAEVDTWEASPDGRAWLAEGKAEEAARRVEQLEQERLWADEYPAEWAAWTKVRDCIFPEFGADNDFPEFLRVVGRRPSKEFVLRPKATGGVLLLRELKWSKKKRMANLVTDAGASSGHESLMTELQIAIIERLDRIEKAHSNAVVKEAYTTEEAAERLTRSEWTVRQWCNKGQVKGAYKVRGKGRTGEWRLPHEALSIAL